MQLLADALERRILPRVTLGQQAIKAVVVFAQCVHHLHGGYIEFGQAPGVVGHLLEEFGCRFAVG